MLCKLNGNGEKTTLIVEFERCLGEDKTSHRRDGKIDIPNVPGGGGRREKYRNGAIDSKSSTRHTLTVCVI
jgi:hypothetical protein